MREDGIRNAEKKPKLRGFLRELTANFRGELLILAIVLRLVKIKERRPLVNNSTATSHRFPFVLRACVRVNRGKMR